MLSLNPSPPPPAFRIDNDKHRVTYMEKSFYIVFEFIKQFSTAVAGIQ
jgi:hypothetical protein